MKRVAKLMAALALGAAVPASALTSITLTGTVAGGDFAGLFGDPGTDISGLTFTAQYFVDFDTPGAAIVNGANVYGNDLEFESGARFGSGPAITASLTINGHSVAFTGNQYGVLDQADRFLNGACFGCYLAQQLTDRDAVYHTESSLNFVTGGPFSAPSGNGFYTALDFDTDPANRTGNFNVVRNGTTAAYGSLYASHLTIATAAPVPEPGEWAMMFAGLSIVGAVARRRSNKETCA